MRTYSALAVAGLLLPILTTGCRIETDKHGDADNVNDRDSLRRHVRQNQ